MKKVLSVSLGSSSRDHSVQATFLNQEFLIERKGTDGDMDKAIQLIKEYDGKVDVFGLGGIDLYIYAGSRRYTFRDAKKMAQAATKTPVVDGSSLKNTLERNVIHYLNQAVGLQFAGKKVLMVCALDRFGMAQTLYSLGADMVFGDLIFALGIPIKINKLGSLENLARLIAPIAVNLPFKMLYPTGAKQEQSDSRYDKYYEEADIIAGDFLYIKRYMPASLKGKIIITNTVTSQDINLLRNVGVKMLVTTTPELNGRSFGTNVMEGVLTALAEKRPENMTADDFSELLKRINFKPRVINFSIEQVG